jgi:hypothetical protein
MAEIQIQLPETLTYVDSSFESEFPTEDLFISNGADNNIIKISEENLQHADYYEYTFDLEITSLGDNYVVQVTAFSPDMT